MKRILLTGIIGLTAAAVAFAGWPDDVGVGADVKTGIRTEFFTGAYGDKDTDFLRRFDPANPSFYMARPEDRVGMALWNDDAGNRADWWFWLDRGHYGFRFHSGNWAGWTRFLENQITFRIGYIDEGAWGNPAPNDDNWGHTGDGFRAEIRPRAVPGLTTGVMFKFNNANNPGNQGGDGGWLADMIDRDDWRRRAIDVITSPQFGARYDTEKFNVGAGLEMLGYNIGRANWGFGFGGRNDPVMQAGAFFGGSNGGVAGVDTTVGENEYAVNVRAGFEWKGFKDVNIQVGATAWNVDKLGVSGYGRFAQRIWYGGLPVELAFTANQRIAFYDPNMNFVQGNLLEIVEDNGDKLPIHQEYSLWGGYRINGQIWSYFEIPVSHWGDFTDVSLKLGMDYNYGPNKSITVYNFTRVSLVDGVDGVPPIRNAVQINFAFWL